MIQNPYQNLNVEFHILQSFPVSCLNRDDVGAPKTAVVGGTTRSRVSSQCWKRQVRLAMRDFGANLGTRTKLISALIANECKAKGLQRSRRSCGDKIEQIFIKKPRKIKNRKRRKALRFRKIAGLMRRRPRQNRYTFVFKP